MSSYDIISQRLGKSTAQLELLPGF